MNIDDNFFSPRISFIQKADECVCVCVRNYVVRERLARKIKICIKEEKWKNIEYNNNNTKNNNNNRRIRISCHWPFQFFCTLPLYINCLLVLFFLRLSDRFQIAFLVAGTNDWNLYATYWIICHTNNRRLHQQSYEKSYTIE